MMVKFPESSRVVAVVDDEPLVLRILGRLLGDLGHRVLLFDDPTIAAESIPLRDVDAIVLDLEMPRMSGVELARRLSERAHDGAPPRLLVTGTSGALSQHDRSLFASVHAKPIGKAALDRALRSAFRPARRVVSAADGVSRLPSAV